MRLIYIVLLGMLIFNAMILIFAPFFPAESIVFTATNPEETHGSYENIGNQDWIAGAVVTGIGVLTAAALISYATKSILWLAAGCFIAFIAGLWSSISSPITSIITYFSYSGVSFYHLFVICLGIVFTASVVEMLVQQRGAG